MQTRTPFSCSCTPRHNLIQGRKGLSQPSQGPTRAAHLLHGLGVSDCVQVEPPGAINAVSRKIVALPHHKGPPEVSGKGLALPVGSTLPKSHAVAETVKQRGVMWDGSTDASRCLLGNMHCHSIVHHRGIEKGLLTLKVQFGGHAQDSMGDLNKQPTSHDCDSCCQLLWVEPLGLLAEVAKMRVDWHSHGLTCSQQPVGQRGDALVCGRGASKRCIKLCAKHKVVHDNLTLELHLQQECVQAR